jgi:hypothetical protein
MHTCMRARIVVPEKRWGSAAMEGARARVSESSRALGTGVDKERTRVVRVVKRECRVVQRRPAKKLGSAMKEF